eukprot:3211215-Prorocentrum_lima.AAC.1
MFRWRSRRRRTDEKKQRSPAGVATPFPYAFAVDEGGNLSGGACRLSRRYAKRDAAGSASADLDD